MYIYQDDLVEGRLHHPPALLLQPLLSYEDTIAPFQGFSCGNGKSIVQGLIILRQRENPSTHAAMLAALDGAGPASICGFHAIANHRPFELHEMQQVLG